MIVTLTMNPSVDRTATLAGELRRGGVNRLEAVDDCAGGKGVNVARVCHDAGAPTLAVFPAPSDDPFVGMCRAAGLETDVVPVAQAVRVNLTVTEPDGTTTKLNAPGVDPGTEALDDVKAALAKTGDDAATAEDLNAKVTKLNEVSQAMGTAMYAAAQAEQQASEAAGADAGAGSTGPQADNAGQGDDDEVVDAEVVDDDDQSKK